MSKGFIAQVICAMSGHQQLMAGFEFADDVDLCMMDASHDGHQVVHKMQEPIKMWAGLLQAMAGRSTSPKKCIGYYIHKWKKVSSNTLCHKGTPHVSTR